MELFTTVEAARFLRSDELSLRAKEMGGFDLSGAGAVRFVV